MKPLINFKTIFTTLLYLSISLFPLQAYNPTDRFTLNCGTTGNSTDGQRTWTGDTNSKLLSSLQNNPTTVSVPKTTQKPPINKIPYLTARLSHSIFNYSFPVTKGPKFLRLFFYPTTYTNGFNRYDASFTVISNGFTLLKDFNASLNADVEGVDTLFKEYVINVGDDQIMLDLSFIPSSGNSTTYAFVNGIEVLSMPDDLYYTPSDDPGFSLVGSTSIPTYTIPTTVALETDYRIRVGVQENSPSIQDTGLLRDWNIDDINYLKTPTSLDFVSEDINHNTNITVIPDYVAPQELFRSSRDLGTNATLNKLLNLTWEFPVDYGFMYFIRLHFCELDPKITIVSDRVFIIYLQGYVAEDRADVLKWTQDKKGVAVQQNYAVLIPKSNNNSNYKVNLKIQMHSYENSRRSLYNDPFLNGLEIFKISDVSSKNLAGPNPVQSPKNPDSVQEKKKSISRMTIICVVLGVAVFGVVLLFLVVFFRKTKDKNAKTTKDSKSTTTSKWGPSSFSKTKSTNTQNSSLPLNLCRNFSLLDIRAATNNFNELFIIGLGGFGHVYKGYIDNGSSPVAIKRLKPGSQQGENEFINEIDMLSKLRHLHLVSLIGYCNENNEMIIVYDFMERGTLHDHLYNTENPSLSWKQRLQISIGAARGLHYLHTGAKHTIIHRDVKTTNILLDDKWIAKVSDFGLSRIGPTGISKAHVSTVVKGSVGYLDPEYCKRQRLTEKSDVYSFVVVLFEILCARPPLIRTAEKKQVSLADWGRFCYKSGTLRSIVDPSVKWSIAPECLRKFGEIAVSCLLDDGTMRPSMNDIVWMLEFALQLQESAEQREPHIVPYSFGGEGVVVGIENDSVEDGGRDENDDMFSSGTFLGHVSDFNKSSEVSVSTISAGSTSGEHSYGYNKQGVFSELMDPKGR